MKNILFLLLLFMSCVLSAQKSETVASSSKTVVKEKPKENQAARQKSIREKWLQAKGRKKSPEEKIKIKANAKYDKLGYMAATDKYKMLDANEASDRQVMTRMANAYRMNGHTEEAEYWYAKVARQADKPEDLLHYAQVLQSNGKCEDALRWHKAYQEKLGEERGDSYSFMKDCDEIKAFVDHEGVSLKNMESLNSKHLEFCGIPYKDGLVFTSTRSSNKVVVNTDSWSNDNFTDLYFAKMDDAQNIKSIKPLEGDINGKHHDGVATFDQSGSVMIFSRNSKEGKSKEGLIDLKIYMAYNYESYWSDVKALTFNSEDFATSHPTLSSDGNRLYFSSDRPGGYGGMDIYVSVYNGSGWNEPINLGATVNSAGNEIFPTIASDNTLYYSSNGHLGLGGSDIFFATKDDADDEESWNVRENIGRPFNSEKDDFGFYINEDKNAGFLSSNRDGGKGGDDIYRWSGPLNDDDALSKKWICVYDEETNQIIEGATVTVYEKDISDQKHSGMMDKVINLSEDQQAEILNRMNVATEQQSFTTNDKGRFLFPVKRGQAYSMRVEKQNFKTKELDVNAETLLSTTDYCIEIETPKCQSLTIIVMDKEEDKLLPDSKVTVTNTCTGKKEIVTTRRDGTARVCMECNCKYELEATKDLFSQDRKTITAQPGNCSRALGEESVMLLTLLQPKEPKESAEVRDLKQYFLGNPDGQFYAGQVITINDLYYDYNKWDIRADAEPRLDKIQQLLKFYPNMEIEMMSHTDSRGRQAYNTSLSEKRAKSAIDYLVNKGVSASRLTSKGYGESQLTNRCADGVSCSDTEHQLNRRTEIRIRKL